VWQKQLDDLNLAPCRHLCRWRGETHIAGQSGLKPSVIMQRWSEGLRAFAVETFFENNDTATVMQRVFRPHFDNREEWKGSDTPNNIELSYKIQDYCIHRQQEASWSPSKCTNTGKFAPSNTCISACRDVPYLQWSSPE
jgi:hypothetical protein